MPISVKRPDSVTVIFELSGSDLVMGPGVREFESMVGDCLAEGVCSVVLDMSALNYIDSAGVGAVVGSSSKVHEAGGRLRLASPTGRVRQILRMSMVDTVIPVDSSVEAACAALKEGQ